MICEMCGFEAPHMDKVLIDGALLTVCNNCKRYGTVVTRRPVHNTHHGHRGHPSPKTKPKDVLETEEILSYDYNKKIQQGRNSLGLSQQDLANKLNEKKSIIQKLETGELRPDNKLVAKLERTLHIKLKEKIED